MASTSFFSTGNTPSIEPNDFNTLVTGLTQQSAELAIKLADAQALANQAAQALADSLSSASSLEFIVQQKVEQAQLAAAAAEASAVAAELAKQAAQSSVGDAFGRDYLGVKAADPTTDNEGNPLITGALYFNSTTQELKVYNGTAWQGGVIGASATATVAKFSGDGSTTIFTLPTNPADKANTQAFIHGVYQQKDTYSVSGTTLTFSEAPPAGTENIEILIISTLPLGTTGGSTPVDLTLPSGLARDNADPAQTSLNAGVVRLNGTVSVSPAVRVKAGDQLGTVTADHRPLALQKNLTVVIAASNGDSEVIRAEVGTDGVILARQSGLLAHSFVYFNSAWRK